MFKKTVSLLLSLCMLLSFTPAFAADDYAMNHVEFSATTSGTTLDGAYHVQFLFRPDEAIKEKIDIDYLGINKTDVYNGKMTASFVLKLVDSPVVTAVREFRQSYAQITVTNAPVSSHTIMLTDGRFVPRISPAEMQAHSPELTEWAKEHPNWASEIDCYANTGCYVGTTDVVLHYDRDGITVADADACVTCEENSKVTEQTITVDDTGFSLSDASKWTKTNWPMAADSIWHYYGSNLDEYAQYTPSNLEEGWYDIYFWNMKCYDQQNPVKMTATVYADGLTFTQIPLETSSKTTNGEGEWTKIGTYYFDGTNDEYMRLVSNGGSTARPASAKFVKNTSFEGRDKATSRHITTFGMGFSKSGTWNPSTFADSTGNTASGASYYGETLGSYTQYMPYDLEPGWYDISFWNIMYNDHQNPMKMTGTVYSNGQLTEKIELGVSTATENGKGAWTKVGTYYFDGSNTEYFRLVSTYEGTTSRPSDVKFENNDTYTPPRVKEQEIGYGDSGLTLSNESAWNPTNWPMAADSMWHYYGNTLNEYVQYTPTNLEPGWYDISFWNMKCFDQQNPVKMTGTVYSNSVTKNNIPLETTTATTNGDGTWTKVGTYYFSGTNDEYFRLVSTGVSNARPASVRFIKNETYVPPRDTEQEIGYGDSGLTLSNESAWYATNWPMSETSIWHYYGNTLGEYVQYTPSNLEPGWYDISFWNMKCYDQQNPVKMTATVHANGRTKTGIPLATTTATTNGDGTWTPIGTFYFAGTDNEYLRLVSTGVSNARPANARFVKNDEFVPPPTLGDEEVTFELDGNAFTTDGVAGTYDMHVDVTGASIPGKLAIYVNDALVDIQNTNYDSTGKKFFGTYTFEDMDTIEIEYIPEDADADMPFTDLIFAPAEDLIIDYELFNINREKEQFFIEASNYKVSATVTNKGNDTNVQLFASLVADETFTDKDGEEFVAPNLKKVAMSDKTAVSKDGTVTISAEIPVNDISNGQKLKVFVWEGTDTMIPKQEAKIYDAADNIVPTTFSIIPESYDTMGTWNVTTIDDAFGRKTMDGLRTSAPDTAHPAVANFTALPGTYKVWARTKNFTDRPQLRHSQISINGATLDKTFGQVGTNGWVWEDGGTVTLSDGANTLSLIDSSAAYAKCDMIILSDDLDYAPTGDYEALLKEAPPIYAYNKTMSDSTMMSGFKLDGNYPGSNYDLTYMADNTVTIGPDSSNSLYTWWYWNFKATSDVERTVNFKLRGFHYESLVGYSGVVYSTDGGESWNYLNDGEDVSNTEFSYTFEPGQTVQFSSVMPYQVSDLLEYLDTIKDIEGVDISVLCKSEEGRDVPLVRIGNPEAPYAAIFEARTHCSETASSYLMEGVLTYLANNQDDAAFDDYCFYIIPMNDIDGVENGDQGKHRIPHDHNRDYYKDRYATTRAIKTLAETLDIKLAIDFHGPSIRDKGPYIVYCENDNTEGVLKFHEMMIAASEADTTENKISYVDGLNRIDGADGQIKDWLYDAEGGYGISFEFPYSGGATGDVNDEFTEERMQNFGKLTADTILEYAAYLLTL